jgi:primosomal protein N' (replication factor Y)
MSYYHVWVRSTQYRGNEALTYKFAGNLSSGAIVEVPLRKQKVLGIIIKLVPRPDFATKSIITTFPLNPLPQTTLSLAKWLKAYYPSPVGVIMQQFLPRSIKFAHQRITDDVTPFKIKDSKLPELTIEQRAALKIIKKPDTYIVHGRTGSGKTRLYLELAKQTLENGRSVLVLSPEIGLTSQLAINFRQLFGDRVIVLHSQLTLKEREKSWLAALEARSPIVVIGPRSALFSPINNIGLIVVDESHDSAYKQAQPPYYHANRVASQLSHIHKAILIFGSATPSVTEYYLAIEKNKAIIQLEHLALPQSFEYNVVVVDLKDRAQFPRSTHLSLALIQAIEGSLKRKEQTLLYLNRRGTARITLCSHCGWQAMCPHCNLPLTYHGDSHLLQCHVCGHHQALLTACPNCGNTEIMLHGFGTKAIVEEVQHIFPEARIMRFDTDNAKIDRLENQYQHILDREVDILVGTQILAKGLDLPHLSTLGVVAADSSLLLPDYTAQERTYQLLTQVLGRIGRGHTVSRAIIQTYHPNSALLQSILQSNWKSFYNAEIKERKRYFFPPFCHILKLTCRRASIGRAEKTANTLKNLLLSKKLGVQIEGPAPAFHEQVGGKYYWQIVVKSYKRSALINVIDLLPPGGWSYDLDPIDLL